MFDRIDESALLFGETSCLSKRDGILSARATDLVSAGKSLDEFLAADHFQKTAGEVLCLGAGGSAIAITVHLLGRAARIIVVNRSQGRLDAMRAIHARVNPGAEVAYIRNVDPLMNDALMGKLPAGSLVINATGMGKDTPGSPISNAAEFPMDGIVWEVNYRGELEFLKQALRQRTGRALQVHDGWRYFIHGWVTVIEEVFDLQIRDDQLARLAVLSDSEIFGRYQSPSARRLALRRAKLRGGRAPIDFSELAPGDLVVHLDGRIETTTGWPGAH